MSFHTIFGGQKKKGPIRTRFEQVELELKGSLDTASRALLQDEFGRLAPEVALEDFVESAHEGPSVRLACDQLNIFSRMAEADPTQIPANAATMIALAIHHGAPIYNSGSHIGCAYIYDLAARLLLRMIENPQGLRAGLKPVAERLHEVNFGAITPIIANGRAWELRAAFDSSMEVLAGMLQPSKATMPSILISYRREDAAAYARLLYNELSKVFGASVFFDLESIECGDFSEQVQHAVAECSAMVIVISPNWLGKAGDGNRRIDEEDDFVCMEVAEALKRGIRVVPVLIGGSKMPRAADLPDCLKGLAKKQFIEVTDQRIDYDVGRVVKALKAPARPVATSSSTR